MTQVISIRGLAFSALFAALLVVFSYISIPLGFTPVPITLQTLAVMLAGGLLGAKYGFISMLIVVGLTALGFPMLGGRGGLGVILGPTGGFIIMWPLAALLIGLFVGRIRNNGWLGYGLAFLVMALFGSLLLYVVGVPWLAQVKNWSMEKAIAGGFYPFIPGDLIKAAAAAAITMSLRQVFPQSRLTGHQHTSVRQSHSA